MARWHDARLAGRWYSGSAAALRDEVRRGIAAAAATGGQRVDGIIVPHAGYMYSGAVAAHGYATLVGGDYRRVVILAPSHFSRFRGVAALRWDGFETPLGRVAIDGAAVEALLDEPLFSEDDGAFAEEHALEIQLPFLQLVLPEAMVVPLLLGEVDLGDSPAVVATLNQFRGSDTVFVVSSDFTHYGRRFGYMPFAANDPASVSAELRTLDFGAIDRVCAGDAEGFRRYVATTGATICGRTPIAVFLDLHKRRSLGRLLRYQTSLDVTGDFEHCVSYASIVFPSA
ncbi:MAG TPA: AmmeMemoRadiSam system protein B [Candidatus Acidoferrales bacterium]|nr:AmmeMemoRadiSam system protein B [Candidatus Acidoferrales bacterium]